jgi:cell division inhibitor SepF
MGVMNKLMAFFGLQDEEDYDTNRRNRMEPEEIEDTVHEVRRHRGNVVSIHQQKHTRMILSEPRSYEEAQNIADHLRSRRPVLVNLQRVRPDQAMRMVDFLSGTVYALNGHIAKVGPNIFVCTPESVELEGTISEMLNSGDDA